MMIETGILRTVAIFRLAPSGQCDQNDVVVFRIRPDLARDFKSINVRHADVKQNGVWPKACDYGKRAPSIVGDLYLCSEVPKKYCQAGRSILVVVYDQHSSPWHVG